MLSSIETPVIKIGMEKKLDGGMKMLRWKCRVSREDTIQNKYIRGMLKVV